MGKVVYVFNGYTDLRETFDGKTFFFPFNKTTTVEDLYSWTPDEYKRNHESDPQPQAVLERTYAARQLAETLLNRHNNNLIEDRCVYIGETEPTAEQKKSCIRYGEFKKRKQVEEALAARKQALQKGGNPELDRHIADWIIELDIKDDTYNAKEQADPIDVMATAMERAMERALSKTNAPKPEAIPLPAGRR